MPRIDMLTAQMRQRAVNRASILRAEKIQLFDINNQILGEGAALSDHTIHEILTEIAPVPLDDKPVDFPYNGRDGRFQISVRSGAQGFEIRTLSFAPAQTELLQNPPELAPSPAPAVAPSKDEWFYLVEQQQVGPYPSSHLKSQIRSGGIRRGTYLWQEGLAEWVAVEQSDFKSFLPALPNAWGDSENIWYYRSMTGQPVPLDKSQLVEKLRSGELTGNAWVWHKGMLDWANASSTELASAISPLNVGGAPIAPPTGGGHPLPNHYGSVDLNTSGGGAGVTVPREARGLFNVGAFLFPAFWCFSMGMPALGAVGIGLNVVQRTRLPYLGWVAWIVKIVLSFYLGFMGNSLAWQYRRFNSIEDFKKCQRIWGIVSGAIYAVLLILGIAVWLWIFSRLERSFGDVSYCPRPNIRCALGCDELSPKRQKANEKGSLAFCLSAYPKEWIGETSMQQKFLQQKFSRPHW